jgi:hypothetical protein
MLHQSAFWTSQSTINALVSVTIVMAYIDVQTVLSQWKAFSAFSLAAALS